MFTGKCAGCDKQLSRRWPPKPHQRSFCSRSCYTQTQKGSLTKFLKLIIKTKTCWFYRDTKHPERQRNLTIQYKSIRVHRVSWEIHNGPIPKGMCVCHRCDVPACVNPQHLFLGTQTDNLVDMRNKNRDSHGEKHKYSKLTADQVQQIRELASKGKLQCVLAKQFKVSQQHISDIINQKKRKRG